MYKDLSTEQLRDKLLMVWMECEFGVKERVKGIYPQRTIQYILSTKTYTKRDKMIDIIKVIEDKIEEVKSEVEEMQKSVKNIIAN